MSAPARSSALRAVPASPIAGTRHRPLPIPSVRLVVWEIARTPTRAFDSWLDDVIALVARVQEPSGYVDTWIQGVAPEKRCPMRVWLPRAPR